MGLQAPLLCLLPSCSRQAEPALQDLGWVCGIRASVCSVSVFLLAKEGGQRATGPQRNGLWGRALEGLFLEYGPGGGRRGSMG